MSVSAHIEPLLFRLCRPLGISFGFREISVDEAVDPSTDANAAALRGEERTLWTQLRSPKRRREFSAGRAAAKAALRASSLLSPEDPIEIGRTAAGAPRPPRPNVHISISHTKGAAVAVVAPFPVGIDIETDDPRPDALLRYFFSDAEQHVLSDTPPALRTPAVNRLWTRKEAAVKVGRWGGSLPFREVDCTGTSATLQGRRLVLHTDMEDRFVASIAYDKDFRHG